MAASQRLVEGFAACEIDGSALEGLYLLATRIDFTELVGQLTRMCGDVPTASQLRLWQRMAQLFNSR